MAERRTPYRVLARQFLTYGAVGVLGTALDFGLYWALIAARVFPWLAATLAFSLATAAQFYLNRTYSFAAFDRHVLAQLGSYIAVTLAQLLLTVAIVETSIRIGHLDPLVAKAISIPPTAVAGFLGNRYLTFGSGIRAAIRRLRGS